MRGPIRVKEKRGKGENGKFGRRDNGFRSTLPMSRSTFHFFDFFLPLSLRGETREKTVSGAIAPHYRTFVYYRAYISRRLGPISRGKSCARGRGMGGGGRGKRARRRNTKARRHKEPRVGSVVRFGFRACPASMPRRIGDWEPYSCKMRIAKCKMQIEKCKMGNGRPGRWALGRMDDQARLGRFRAFGISCLRHVDAQFNRLGQLCGLAPLREGRLLAGVPVELPPQLGPAEAGTTNHASARPR
jgi:hypothetical protein